MSTTATSTNTMTTTENELLAKLSSLKSKNGIKSNGSSNGNTNENMTETKSSPTSPEDSTTTTTSLSSKNHDNNINTMISFIKYGIIYYKSYSISSIMSMIHTLDGRDKISKLLQYMSRFIAYYYVLNNQVDNAKRFNDMKSSISNSRKVYRLGRSLQEIYKIYTMNIYKVLIQQRQSNKEPLWKTVGNATKSACLAGFWGFDNVTYLAMSGFFDNYNTNNDSKKTNTMRRQQIQTESTIISNRFYFIGAIIGLYVNIHSYLQYYYNTVAVYQNQKQQQKDDDDTSDKNGNSTIDDNNNQLQNNKIKEQQWILFISIVKSACDVTVFSNNPGIDLWMKYYGTKNHEGIHCLCGIMSSLVVIYQNLLTSKVPTSSVPPLSITDSKINTSTSGITKL